MRGRTRIKMCGLRCIEDAVYAADLGVDAIGLVFYPPSVRHISSEQAALLVRELPPFVQVVGLFVQPAPDFVRSVLENVPLNLLQFHGDESEAECMQYGRPYIKAARVRPELDLIQYRALFPEARSLLLDAHVDGFGGSGQSFDWRLVPTKWQGRYVLSGGLTVANVGDAITGLRPAAVDVSSGIESSRGVKDPQKMRDFVEAVRKADESI